MRRTFIAIGFVAIALAFLLYTLFGPQNLSQDTADSPAPQPPQSMDTTLAERKIVEEISAERAKQEAKAKEHITSIKADTDSVIDVENADHFVDANQRIRIPSPEATDKDFEIIEALAPAGTGNSATSGNVTVAAIDDNQLMHATGTEQLPVAELPLDTPAEPLNNVDSDLTNVESGLANVALVSTPSTVSTPSSRPSPSPSSGSPEAVKAPSTHTITITVPAESTSGNRELNVASTNNQGASSELVSDTESIDVIGIQSSQSGGEFTLNELLNTPESTEGDQIYFIHAVTVEDQQGLWGIVQEGLTTRFAQGIKLKSQAEIIQTDIPQHADERLQDNSSSFLGHMLNNKVADVFVYNYKEGRLGDDPNLIRPGQQLVIVRFAERELIDVYNKFFAYN